MAINLTYVHLILVKRYEDGGKRMKKRNMELNKMIGYGLSKERGFMT